MTRLDGAPHPPGTFPLRSTLLTLDALRARLADRVTPRPVGGVRDVFEPDLLLAPVDLQWEAARRAALTSALDAVMSARPRSLDDFLG